jgi:hypothetical protein
MRKGVRREITAKSTGRLALLADCLPDLIERVNGSVGILLNESEKRLARLPMIRGVMK